MGKEFISVPASRYAVADDDDDDDHNGHDRINVEEKGTNHKFFLYFSFLRRYRIHEILENKTEQLNTNRSKIKAKQSKANRNDGHAYKVKQNPNIIFLRKPSIKN